MEAAPATEELSFEAALARLEEIVRLLERGEAPLDQSIELYQEGDRLRRHCEARLKAPCSRRSVGLAFRNFCVIRRSPLSEE